MPGIQAIKIWTELMCCFELHLLIASHYNDDEFKCMVSALHKGKRHKEMIESVEILRECSV